MKLSNVVVGVGMQQVQRGDHRQPVYRVRPARLQHSQHGLSVCQESYLAAKSSLP